MNLVFRCLRAILLVRFAARKDNLDTFTNHYRVGLHDLGWRDHLPNYRYLSFMEIGAFAFFHGTRLATSGLFDTRLIAAQEVIYLRPVRPFQKIKHTTRLIGWDQKYLFFQHEFFVGEKLAAIGLVKEICLNKGKQVTPKELLDKDVTLSPVIDSWLQNHEAIRQSF
ncbi:hypothetical protein A9Q99_06425 [Gammaproteobacteria bacterium 45_16_T64]|nr:hypothetical protein A9Q99_06425 [Gammaproteobacteria bacterium 45_16_T64]